jgi:hypothetical protein
MFWIGKQAGFVYSENAIPIARDKVVRDIPHWSWYHASDTSHFPDAVKLRQQVQNRIRASEQTLGRLAVVNHNVHRVEVLCVCAMTLQQILREAALQRSKPQPVMFVALEQKLVQPIAESTNAIVKDNRIGFRWRHNS